jgi:RNA polymerase sigma-70 factor (ECF subfamily)
MRPLGELSDEELVTGLRETASDDYFEEIFERYHSRVVSWCYTVSRDHDLSLDLAQEVFMKVFRGLRAFRGDSRISTWMYVVTRNHCLNSLRKRETDPAHSAIEIPTDLRGDNGLDSHLAIEQAQVFGKVCHVIRAILTPLEMRILWLHFGNELTLTSITRELVLANPSGAKAYIVSAKRKLNLYLRRRGRKRSELTRYVSLAR